MNVKELREKHNLSQQELADKTGIPRPRIAKWEEGKGNPKIDDYRTLENFFKILGEEIPNETLRNVVNEESGTYNAEGHKNITTRSDLYLLQRRHLKNSSRTYMVPLVPVKAQAGYIKSYANTDFINELEAYPIVPGIEPRGADWRYFEVEGDSMQDTLSPRDYVLASFVPDFDWMDIKDNYVYVIVTKERVMIKRVKKMTVEQWQLKSDNKEYKPERIAVRDILELWRGRRVIGADLGPTKKTKHYDLD